jgi:hypothetical protein
MPTIGNSPEYLYEVSDTKKFQTSDFSKVSILPSIWKVSRFVPEVLGK